MKKILILLLIPLILFSKVDISINECITDIYFANGIMNTKEDARESLDLIKEEIQANLYNGYEAEMLKHHNFDTAYNESYGLTADLFESFLQTVDETVLGKNLWIT